MSPICRTCLSLLKIIILILFSSFSPPFKPWKLWFRMRQYLGQLSPVIVCTREYNYLWWPVTVVLPSLSALGSKSGGCSLSCDGSSINHGNSWECRFPLEVRWRGVMRKSPKVAAGYVCAGLVIWLVFMLQRWSCRGWFRAEAAAAGTRNIDGIILRRLHSKTYCTILGLRRSFAVKTRWQPTLPTIWCGTGGRSRLLSQKGGLFCSFPLQGVGVAVPCGGRSHGEKRRKASKCLPIKFSMYNVCMYVWQRCLWIWCLCILIPLLPCQNITQLLP